MKIKLLDKYIFSQVFFACFGCIFIFMIVWIMPEIFLKTVQKAISGIYTVEMAVSILIYELPKVLNNVKKIKNNPQYTGNKHINNRVTF